MTNRRAGFYAFIHGAPKSYGALGLSVPFLKSGVGVENLRFRRKGAPFSHVANWCARLHARSLRLAQRILTVFVQALDFSTIEALVPHLHPSAEGCA
jgi:hypothetical protein